MIVCKPQHAADAANAQFANLVWLSEQLAPHFEKPAIARCAEVAGAISSDAGEAVRALLEGNPGGGNAGEPLAVMVADAVAQKLDDAKPAPAAAKPAKKAKTQE